MTNEIIYGYFLTLTLLLYQKKPKWSVYLLSGLLFLIRYESIVFPIAIFIVEYFFNKKQFKVKNLIIAFSPILIWFVILNFHSTGCSLIQNSYINEMIIGFKKIPNFKPLSELVDVIVFYPINLIYFSLVGPINFNTIPNTIISYLFPISILLLFLISFFKSKNSHVIKIIYLTMIFHIIFLTLFPNYAIRYQIPIIWILYLLIINRHNQKIKTIIIIALTIFNLIQLNYSSSYDNPNEKSEYRLVSNWLNSQNFKQDTLVFIYDFNIPSYFTQNSKVYFDDSIYSNQPNIYNKWFEKISCAINNIDPNKLAIEESIYNKCNDQIPCVISKYYNNSNYQFIAISTSTSSVKINSILDKYTNINQHHITAFQDSFFSNSPNFKLITKLGNEHNWAKIYQYIPTKSPTRDPLN